MDKIQQEFNRVKEIYQEESQNNLDNAFKIGQKSGFRYGLQLINTRLDLLKRYPEDKSNIEILENLKDTFEYHFKEYLE